MRFFLEKKEKVADFSHEKRKVPDLLRSWNSFFNGRKKRAGGKKERGRIHRRERSLKEEEGSRGGPHWSWGFLRGYLSACIFLR